MGLFGKKYEEDKANRDVIMSGVYPDVSPSRLFNAILLAGAKLSYSIDFIDKGSLSVTFQTHENEKFWDGRLSAFVLNQSGGAKVTVTGSADRGITTSGRGSGNIVTAVTQLASQGGASQQHLRGPPVPEPVALGQRGRGHLQPHGGRRHRRDQPGPALAVGAPGGPAGGRPHHYPGALPKGQGGGARQARRPGHFFFNDTATTESYT